MCAVYVYVVCICVYVCVYVWCVCVFVRYVNMHECVCASVSMHMCSWVCLCICMCMCVCVCVCEGFEAGFTVTIILNSVCGVSTQIVGDLLRYTRFYPSGDGKSLTLEEGKCHVPIGA